MFQKSSMFYNAILLTGVHLLLRLAGTTFQVYLSGRIGAAGIGLLQLTLSAGNLAMIAGMAGIRTASMYLTAEELGSRRSPRLKAVLSVCCQYSVLISAGVGILLTLFSGQIAEKWIGHRAAAGALRLMAGFLPVNCLCGVMTGFFTARGRIAALAAVETLEQGISISTTMVLLSFWAGSDPSRACESVILGSGTGSCFTLLALVFLRLREPPGAGASAPLTGKLLRIALPLALGDLLKTGINTTENLMVPRRLQKNPGISDPLAEFGILSGMVFPVLMFPACILYGLSDLLIPELARCAAGNRQRRIRYLSAKALKIGALYGLVFGGGMHLLADPLCLRLYDSPQAAHWLSRYALLVPMLYCDLLVDAMTKGLGQQEACVRYNILTSALDVLLLFLLLPRYGMAGYYLSFLVTHGLNFLLSLRRLLRITGQKLPIKKAALCILSGILSLTGAKCLPEGTASFGAYLLLLGSLLALTGIVSEKDIRWMRRILLGTETQKTPLPPVQNGRSGIVIKDSSELPAGSARCAP